jgi:predicted phage terminase large subunit-like protein
LSEQEREELDRLTTPSPRFPSGYEAWLNENYPHVCTQPLSARHHRLWGWFDSLTPGVKPDARVEVWGRGGAKSSTAELGTAYVGCKLSRRFVLYVSETQDQADRHVQAVATLFERLGIDRLVNKHGNSKGWRRNQLRTANGFNVEALGLDVAARGIKLDEFRPDLIVFDDIDNQNDGPKIVEKKTRGITSSIIPAGSSDCAILFIQNLIHEFGIVSSLVDDTADFLYGRDVPPIEPSCRNLRTEIVDRGDGKRVYRVVSGEPTWEGQNLQTIEAQINEWGYQTFLREAQHEVKGADGYFFNHNAFRLAKGLPGGVRLRFCRAWDLAATEGGGDYTVGVLMAMAPNGVCYVVDVIRVQYESKKVRQLIYNTACADKELYGEVRIHLPQDPGQAGKDQAQQLSDMLSGFSVKTEPVTGKKSVRARGHAERVNGGNTVLIEADWNRAYTEEHRLFREDEEHERDDQVDASADAHDELAGTKARGPAPTRKPRSWA